jgi:hypothetical protein
MRSAACFEVVANSGPKHGRTYCVLLFTKKTGCKVPLLQLHGLQEYLGAL